VNLLLTLIARATALLGALMAGWVAAVFAWFLVPALEDPLRWDGGGGLESMGYAALAFGVPAVWLAVLALTALLGALVAPLRGWLAALLLVLPGLATFVVAAVAGVGVWLWTPDATALIAVGAGATALPGVVLLCGGLVAWVHARRKRRARLRAREHAPKSRSE
jgi:hypothetical protein